MQYAHIAEPLRRFAVPLASLEPDPRNARLHSERNRAAILRSLRQFGQQRPLVLHGDGRTIMAGNGTWEAARQLGWEYIAAVPATLEGDEATAYGIADNRSAELAKWDFEQLSGLLKRINGLEQSEAADPLLGQLGWEAHEIEPLLQADWEDTAEKRAAAAPVELHFSDADWPVFEAAFRRLGEITGEAYSPAAALAAIAEQWLEARA